ncbi:MAG: hypothetical protein V4696_03480 [Pseudomonadota bacterium]
MKKLQLSLVVASSVALTSCLGAAVGAVGVASDLIGKVTAAGDVVQIRGTQALIIAEEFYQPANRLALTAVRSGGLPDATVLRIRDLNRKITAAFVAGKEAKTDASRAVEAAKAMTSVLELRSLVGLPN